MSNVEKTIKKVVGENKEAFVLLGIGATAVLGYLVGKHKTKESIVVGQEELEWSQKEYPKNVVAYTEVRRFRRSRTK